MKTTINSKNGLTEIKGKEISQEQEGEVGYSLTDREQQINDLYMWIGEATGSDKANDLYLMKEDLHYLEGLEDEFIFSNLSTNEFIAKSDDEKRFNEICGDLLNLKGSKKD